MEGQRPNSVSDLNLGEMHQPVIPLVHCQSAVTHPIRCHPVHELAGWEYLNPVHSMDPTTCADFPAPTSLAPMVPKHPTGKTFHRIL
jgi:hypothetical protein